MRKSLSVLFLLSSIFPFISCSKKLHTFTEPDVPSEPYEAMTSYDKRSALSGRTYNPELAMEELSRPEKENGIPFTLNYAWYGSPVVKITLDDKDLFVLVDTGCSYSFLFKNGIEKIYGTEGKLFEENNTYEWYRQKYIDNNKKLKNLSRAKVMERLRQDLRKGKVYTYKSFGNFKFRYYSTEDREVNGQRLDGCLGADFLMQYKNVVFDFTENYLYFDQPQIDGTVLKMKKNINNQFYINFSYKGKSELGLVDTGNYTFTPRNGIGDRAPEHDINDKAFNMNAGQVVKQIPPAVWTFDDIEIGGIKYENVKAQYSFTTDSGFNYGAQYHGYCISNLGNEFYFGHIIQLDFENMKFIIK